MTYRIKNHLLVFLVLSLLIHAPLFWLAFSPPSKSIPEEEMTVLVIVPKTQQVIHQDYANHLQPQKDSHYMSATHQAIEQETKAMHIGLFQQAHQSTVVMPHSKAFPAHQKRHIATSQLKNVALPPPAPHSQSYLNNQKLMEMLAPSLVKNPLSLGPFPLEGDTQFSARMEIIPHVETGSHTLLNTTPFIYYSYYSRMTRQIYTEWVQHLQQELKLLYLHDLSTHPQIFSTHLQVAITSNGELKDVQVTKSSGKEFVDSAALYAFLAASPFPNPPEGLIGEDGYIHLQKGFYLQITPSIPPPSRHIRKSFTNPRL